MVSELNMYESQVAEYKYEIERLARELQDVKKKYFLQKKKEQNQRFIYTHYIFYTQQLFLIVLILNLNVLILNLNF